MQIISKLIDPDRNRDDWDEQIAYALMAYRSSVQQSTGETPNTMMLGRKIELTLDVIMEKVPGEEIAETVYVEALRERMKAAWDRAQQALKLSARRQNKYHDRNAQLLTYKKGEVVWYFISARKKGVSKKQAKWDGSYKILDKLSDVTYRIRKGKQAKPKVVQFDKIKPFKGKLPVGWSRIPET